MFRNSCRFLKRNLTGIYTPVSWEVVVFGVVGLVLPEVVRAVFLVSVVVRVVCLAVVGLGVVGLAVDCVGDCEVSR